MFEKIINDFYVSLGKSIKERKTNLSLKRDEILNDPKRITEIVHGVCDKHHPNLIGKSEYDYLYCLYISEDRTAFFDSWGKVNEKYLSKKKTSFTNLSWLKEKHHIKSNGNNYDKMLWGHIDWNTMFENVITELSELDSSKSLGKLFEDTLIDYVPYAIIKYDELNSNYGKIYIFPEDRETIRNNAIQWVHLRYKSTNFKRIFLQKFKGKTLKNFDKQFKECVEDYLKKKSPDSYSFGLQAYNLHKSISEFEAHYSFLLREIDDDDKYNKKKDLLNLLDDYLQNGKKQIKKLEKYQQDFDSINVK